VPLTTRLGRARRREPVATDRASHQHGHHQKKPIMLIVMIKTTPFAGIDGLR